VKKTKENLWHYEQVPKRKTKLCPSCGKAMPWEFSSMVMTSNPPQQRWYWDCKCGYQELGGIHVHNPIKNRVMI
jgi:formate dehydrogenase maturation protein FdhE